MILYRQERSSAQWFLEVEPSAGLTQWLREGNAVAWTTTEAEEIPSGPRPAWFPNSSRGFERYLSADRQIESDHSEGSTGFDEGFHRAVEVLLGGRRGDLGAPGDACGGLTDRAAAPGGGTVPGADCRWDP